MLVLVVDVRIALRENIPANQAIQNHDAVHSPEQLEAFRATMVRAFYTRSTLMMLCFLLVNLAWFFSR